MWSTGVGWGEALSGDIGVSCSAAVWLGGEVTVDQLVILGGSVRSELSGDQIQTTVSLQVADPEASLFTAIPGDPIGAEGHRLRITSTVSAGRWAETVPVGTFRVNGVAVDSMAPWRLYPESGVWVRGPQVLTITASDLLDQVADERFMAPTSPTKSTVGDEVARLVAGIVPAGAWTTDADRAIPSTLSYDTQDRLGAVVDLLRVDGALPWVDRDGVLQALPATGSGDEWLVPTDAMVSVAPSVDRAALRNGWVVTSESESRQGLRGQTLEDTGPLRWGGPFGRVPEFAHRPILTSNAQCQAASVTASEKSIAGRRQVMTVVCGTDPALDVLDTAVLRLPTGDVPGLVLAVERDLLARDMTVRVSVDWREVRTPAAPSLLYPSTVLYPGQTWPSKAVD